MIRRPPRSTQSRSSAASDVYKRQVYRWAREVPAKSRREQTLRSVAGCSYLPVAFGLADPLAQDLKESVRDLRVLLEKRLEAPFRDGRQGDVCVRLDGGAAAFMVEQGHLAERIAGPELSRLALDGRDGHGAVEDDHEADAVLALHHDLAAGWMLDGPHLLFDGAQL